MASRYVIASINDEELEISEDDFAEIISAIAALLHLLDGEEKFDAIVENYRELEAFMFDQALNAILSGSLDEIFFQLPRSTASRRLGNLLSSARLYQDSISRHADAISKDEKVGTDLKLETNRQYDSSLNYRILEALRNHAQHYALPVHSFSIRKWWDRENNQSNHEFDPAISVSELAINPNFKKSTLAEMQKGPDLLKLKPMAREYVECLSNIHYAFRNLIEPSIAHQIHVLEDSKRRFAEAHPSAPDMGLSAYQVGEDGTKVEVEYQLGNTLTQYVAFLKRKNRHLIKFAERRVFY